MIKGIILADGTRLKREDAYALALQHGHVDGWPLEALVAVLERHPRRRPGAWDIASASYRRCVLEEITPHYDTLRNLYPLVRGRFLHKGAEGVVFPPNLLAHKDRPLREFRPENPWVGCKIDLYYPATATLVERKTTGGRAEDIPLPTHIAQANIYAWAMRRAHWAVKRILIVYYTWWGVKTTECPVWPDDEVDMFVKSGVDIFNRAFYLRLVPPPTQCSLAACDHCPVKRECRAIARPEWVSWDELPRHGFALEPNCEEGHGGWELPNK